MLNLNVTEMKIRIENLLGIYSQKYFIAFIKKISLALFILNPFIFD